MLCRAQSWHLLTIFDMKIYTYIINICAAALLTFACLPLAAQNAGNSGTVKDAVVEKFGVVQDFATEKYNIAKKGVARAARNTKIFHIAGSVPEMQGAGVAVMAVTAGGEVLADVDASRMLVPASNMKLVSTGAALHLLGPGFRYRTVLAADGPVENGTLRGNLYIVGGGDPTLAGKDKISLSADSLFFKWCNILKDRGIRRVDGRVIADGSAFGGMREHPAWLWEDIGTYYGAGSSALIYRDNELRFSVCPGAAVGEPLKIRQLSPYTPWLDLRYECSTGESGTGDQLYLYTTDFSDVAIMRGTFALGKKTKTVLCANKQPERSCATEFVRYMNAHGISGGAAEGSPEGCGHGTLKEIGVTLSPELSDIVRVTNRDSNNLFAETLFRTVGREFTGSACYDSSAVAVRRLLADMAVDARGAVIVDGSGLSRKNYVSPAFLCDFLSSMTESPAWEAYLGSLPRPGCEGTLKNAFGGLPQDVREHLHLKSGSMDGVLCYSGYYIPDEGDMVIISVMINNSTAPVSVQKSLIERILAVIIE